MQVIQAYYGAELLADRSPSSIAWIGGLQYFFLFALVRNAITLQPCVELTKTQGLPTTFIQSMGHTRKVVWTGTFLVVIAQLGVSFCDQYYQLILVQGVIFGLGSGMLMSAASTTVPHWFER
jgi:MCP family monocarboxylic acid transporter-like MFS transporter 10